MANLAALLARAAFGRSPAPSSDQALGTTPQASPDSRPRAGMRPYGASGRANFYGLPQPDELNPKLVGPRGLRVFDEMYRTDPDIRRLILMAWSPIVAGTWSLEPHGGDDATDQDREIAQTVWEGLNTFMSPNFLEHLQAAGPILLRSGFAPFEQIWDTWKRDGKSLLFPRKLDVRLPRSIWRWWQDDYGELTAIGQILPNKTDVVIPLSELVYYRLAPEGDNWVGTSLLRQAYKPWYLKDRLERIDAIGQERKAVGLPIIYPPEGADSDTRGEVETVFANAHVNEVGYIMMPGPWARNKGPEAEPVAWDVDVIQFDSSSGDSIMQSLAYHRAGIASSIVADFMQLGHHQVGARATADIQEDPFLTAVMSMLPDIKAPLQRLIDRIIRVNWAAAGSPTLQCTLTDQASLSEIATYVQLCVAAGAITVDPELEDWLRERAELPPANSTVRELHQQAQQAALKASALQSQQPAEVSPTSQTPPRPQGVKPGQQPVSGGTTKTAPQPQRKQLDNQDARWFDRLLSQGKLKTAIDSTRQNVESAARQHVIELANRIADGAGSTDALLAHSPLADALTGEYERLYRLGQQTAADEIARQRVQLHLMSPRDVVDAVLGGRLARARQRGEHSARTIAETVAAKVRQARITGLNDPQQIRAVAQQTAVGQLHAEALTSTAASINDGRWDTASQAPDVVGAYYTSVLDENTCDECEAADTGQMITLDQAAVLGPPNPQCAGGDRCRCMCVYVLSNDPTAVARIMG